MRNRFPGNCDRCLKRVEVGNGVTFRIKGRFFVRCDGCQSTVSEGELISNALSPRNDDEKFVALEPVDPMYEPPEKIGL